MPESDFVSAIMSFPKTVGARARSWCWAVRLAISRKNLLEFK
jgi:hypothetical protein